MTPETKQKLMYLSPLVLFVLMFLLLFSGIGKDPTKLESQLIGKPVPVFSKTSLTDASAKLTQTDLQGPALLNVFASWCPSCYVEHPYLMELDEKNIVTVYGLNYKDSRAKGMKFITDLGNPYEKIVFDENGRLGIELGVYGAPETFVIDDKNQIIYRHVGVVDERVWTQIIKPLIDDNREAGQ